jgi:ATP-binding cassette subfamily F protein 3
MSEESLNPATTVLQALSAAAPPATSSERILATAGAFLFRNDDLDKPYGVLSGGERARVRLARLTLQKHNVLLLDEPTNHLDAETVEVLAEALKEYAGTVIVVSHARTFMNALVDRIYEVGRGTVRQYMGTYEEYVSELVSGTEETEGDVRGREEASGEDAAAKRERALRDKERRKLIKKLEDKLTAWERDRSEILKWFFENPGEYDSERSHRLGNLEEEIARAEAEWMRLSEEPS